MSQKLVNTNSGKVNFRMYKVNKHWVFSCATALTIAAAGLAYGNVANADTVNSQSGNPVTVQVNNQQNATTGSLTANTANTGNNNNRQNIKSAMNDLAGQSSAQTNQSTPQAGNNLQKNSSQSSTNQAQSNSKSVESNNSNQQFSPASPNSQKNDDNYITFSTKQFDTNGNVNFLTQKTYTSIKGQMVADGTVVTWPLTVSDLPANRAQNIKSHIESETLDNNLEYLHYKAFMKNADGSISDVTDHVNLNRNGQTLIFTDDDYLLGLYNANKGTAFSMPYIKLVTKVHGASVIVPNAFKSSYVFNDGDHDVAITTTSNQVQISTYSPNDTKDVEIGGNVQGDPTGSINNQVVADGSVITWPMSIGDLPANRAQNVVGHTETDTLNSNLTYQGFHAYLPTSSGLQDVTQHITAQVNGQNITFVADSYLLSLYNANKTQAFKLPIIDLITQVHGKQVVAPNSFNSQLAFSDGNGQTIIQKTSNQVQISTYSPSDTKDVEMGGNVIGDTSASSNNQMIANGSVVTWPMSSSDLPANRVQNIKEHTITETLNNALQVQGFHAYLFDANGKSTDVTSHVHMTQNGQNITFTDDSYLLGLYNANKATSFKMPIIDLVTKVNGANVTVPNTYNSKFVYEDGDGDTTINVSSNTVKVTTYNPTTSKDVELGGNVHGDTAASISGQQVADGTVVTWPMSASDLPANRSQDIISHTAVDVLEPNLVYQGYSVWLPNADGTLTDVTSHVSMSQSGQTLTFTDDSYLLGLYNTNKGTAFKLPIIDLVTKTNGNTKLIPNAFNSKFVYSDGDGNTSIQVTSNKPNVQTFDPTDTKDVEMGHVQGDTPNSINGQTIATGSVITWPMSTSDLPANRSQNIVSHSTVETLASGLQYLGYKVYLPGANGQLQDVTNHVTLSQSGQTYTFTDDSYLIGLYNANRSVAFKMPIIDLQTKAVGEDVTIPNTFSSQYVYNDGNGNTTFKTTSNTVKVVTYTPTTKKDVELGNLVHGDIPNSIAGEQVTDGTIVTWPMSTSDLPANRAQNITSHVQTDNLDNNLTYVSYTAWLPDANGQLTDVTSHVKLTQNGKQLIFTDDSYLIGLYNAHKDSAFKLPIIDLVTKANGDGKLIPNTFQSQFIYNDGSDNTTVNVTSNTVNLHTYDPHAAKDVEIGDDVEGDTPATIANQVVENGTVITYPLAVTALPANRSDEITKHVSFDTLSNNLVYQSFKAYLPGNDGKLQNVTNHIKLSRDGQNLTFTDDNYLLNLYNSDKTKAQNMPIIDLVTKVNSKDAKTKLIPNNFKSSLTTKDGNGNNETHTTSNTVVVTSDNPEAIKDVELGGNVIGDTPNSITGKSIAEGSIVTWPMSVGNLSANRSQDVLRHVEKDTLDSNLTFVGYKAYLMDANGKAQDVTDHISLTQNGQELTFTDDDYLLGLYNKDKSQRFTLPIIDLVTKANGESKTIPNNFVSEFTFTDGKGNTVTSVTSNTVSVSTFGNKSTKDVELGGNVIGDTAASANGQTVPDGSVITWPLSVSDLPANRAQDMTAHKITDHLNDDLNYVSYKAYLKGADGKLQDVTDHVKLTRDGQELTFTDDDYLLKLYNSQKDKDVALPIIDLVTKANGDAQLIPNNFDNEYDFNDGDGNTVTKSTSNTVTIKTPKASNPVKSETDENGNDLNRKEVKDNQVMNFKLTWDFSNYKGVTTTPDMIKKGFYFLDPLDANALKVGDLNKAEVLDQNGNKVSGISFHEYDKLSDAPETIQQEVKDNNLTALFNVPFVVAQADDPEAFFNSYVKTGSKLTVEFPAEVKDNFVGEFQNTAYQLAFGKAKATNTVTNYVQPKPKEKTPTPEKPAEPVAVETPEIGTSEPLQQVSVPTPSPEPQSEAQAQLPRTGNADDSGIIGLAVAGAIGALSLAGLELKKRN